MSQIIRRPMANADLVAIFRYYAREAGLRVADSFFTEAEATLTRLAAMPRMGTPYDPEERLYAELRFFPVTRFRNHLVFYRPIPDGIEVYRVLHSARDIADLLGKEFDVGEE